MFTKIIAQLVYWFIRLLNFTYRYEFIGLENKEKAISEHPQKIFLLAIWHQNLIGTILAHVGESFTMIISGSKDGELAAIACKKLGHRPARGSSTRGGKKAMVEIVKKMKEGFPGALTVDGPKGPPFVVKPGVIEVARQCQCAILPLCPYPQNFWSFNKSWDQFRLPKPFTKIIVVIGEPIYVPENISREDFLALSEHLAQKINLTEEMAKAQF